MKKKNRKYLLFTLLILWFSKINSQSYDVLKTIVESDIICFDYVYEEFNHTAYLDSTFIMNSFIGTITLKRNIDQYLVMGDTVKYNFNIEKRGSKTQRTFYDTLYSEEVTEKSSITIYVIKGKSCDNYRKQISGWIFRDTLIESTIDTFDTILTYPYRKLFRNYNQADDNSLYYQNDTLIIHYRPITTNYYDSYYIINYYICKDYGLVYYSKYYSYYGAGFRESMDVSSSSIVDNVKEEQYTIPVRYFLSQNYPNPFNPTTTINFFIPTQDHITLKIYDILGKEVETLIDEKKSFGNHSVEFDASHLISGVYFYRLKSANFAESKKFILLK